MIRSGLLKLVGGLGILIHLGFAVWHFAVPRAYRWFEYIPDAPAELVTAISAANFFLSVSMVLLGLAALAVLLWLWESPRGVTLAFSAMALLWALRLGYQILRPQGTMIHGVSALLLVLFGLTTACFLVPAILVHQSV